MIQVSGSNYKANTLFVNESGLYALILSSKLEKAKAFKRWVTAEVLPQIRKTGGYIPTKDAQGRQLSNEEIINRAQRACHRVTFKITTVDLMISAVVISSSRLFVLFINYM